MRCPSPQRFGHHKASDTARGTDHQHGQWRTYSALLAHDPRPPGAKSLQGRPGLRVRVGNCRIIYTFEDDVLLVVVVTVGGRRGVYRT